MERSRVALALAAITALGAAARIASFQHNDLPHGDIHLDYAVATSVQHDSTLFTPVARLRPYPTLRFGFGHPQDQHAPLWPLLGGLLARVLGDPYRAFKWLSWLAGAAAIPLTFAAGRSPLGSGAALLASALTAATWVLCDYSGNGSLYMLHALLFLAFLALLDEPLGPARAAALGAVAGTAWLLNYQAAVLLPALLTAVGLRYGGREAARDRGRVLAVAFAVALALAAPWLIRNALVFGSPLYSVNDRFVATSLGVESQVLRVGDEWLSAKDWSRLRPGDALARIAAWTAGNAGYLALRLWLLAPVATLFAGLAAGRALSLPRAAVSLREWGLLSLLAWHAALSCLWPDLKFRYLVPLLPLLYLLAAQGLWHWTPPRLRGAAAALALAGALVPSLLAYARVPQHTAYYDPNELLSLAPGESEWQRSERLYVEALGSLRDEPPGALLGALSAFYHARRPLLEHRHAGDLDTLAYLMRRFGVRYAVVPAPEAPLFRDAFGCRELSRNAAFVALRCQVS